METNVNYTIVGAFVILLISAIVLSVIWLSSGLSFEKYDTYVVYMEESVSGLTADSPVEFNGVQVGKVKSIELAPNNPRLVKVLLSIKHTTPISKGTIAMLTTRGITGFVLFTLIDTGTTKEPLVIQPGEQYPNIPTQPSIFVRLDKALTDISNSFSRLSDTFKQLFNKENIENFKETLASLRQVTQTLSANSKNIENIVRNTEQASKGFAPMLNSGRSAFRSLEMQTLPAANDALINMDEVAKTLGEVSRELKENPSMLIRGRAQGTPGPGE